MNIPDTPQTRVVLFQIRSSGAKLSCLTTTAALHFKKKESLIILAEDEKAALFVDELLWRSPATSFLPHIATEEPTSDYIAISRLKNNVNHSRHAFNLCPTPLLTGPFKTIYDFEDLTSPSKQQFSALRFDAYKRAGYIIESQSV